MWGVRFCLDRCGFTICGFGLIWGVGVGILHVYVFDAFTGKGGRTMCLHGVCGVWGEEGLRFFFPVTGTLGAVIAGSYGSDEGFSRTSSLRCCRAGICGCCDVVRFRWCNVYSEVRFGEGAV